MSNDGMALQKNDSRSSWFRSCRETFISMHFHAVRILIKNLKASILTWVLKSEKQTLDHTV